jgi:hypothetical protein
MENIHVLTTLKPSRILRGLDGIRIFKNEVSPDSEWCVNVNIHITNDDEIKDGDKRINNYQRKPEGEEIPSKKIILTTDADLIKDGVQAIDDEFLEFIVKNPSCESVEVDESKYFDGSHGEYIIIIPQEEPKQECEHIKEYGCIKDICTCNTGPKQETLEEITANLADPNLCKTDNWIACAKWMLEELQDFDTWKEWKDITFKSE